MGEDLLKKLKEAKEGELSDDDLGNVAGGNKGNTGGTTVTYKYDIGQTFSQNVDSVKVTADTLAIKSRYANGSEAFYTVHIEIWECGVLKKSGDTDVSQNEIDTLIGDAPASIAGLAYTHGIPTVG